MLSPLDRARQALEDDTVDKSLMVRGNSVPGTRLDHWLCKSAVQELQRLSSGSCYGSCKLEDC
jgi:hypothetical protein